MPEQADSAGGYQSDVAEPSPVRLPVWPVAALLLGMPLWWLAGTSLFMWPLLAGIMGLYLLIRGPIRFPVGFGLWLVFLAWVGISGLMLLGDAPDGTVSKYAGNGLLYLSATVLFLYAYRVSRDPIGRQHLVLVGAGFWAVIVVGGWFAVAFPDFSITTPVQRLLPGLDDANVFVARRVTADAAVEGFVGTRPRAPFGEVNEWGSNFALALPFAVLAAVSARRRAVQVALVALIASSAVPVVQSQNRGLWLVLALAGAYALLRFAWPRLRRLPARRLAAAGAAVAVLVAAVAISPIGAEVMDRVEDRVADRALSPGGGDESRAESYRDAISLTAESPLLGHATTQETETSHFPAGTHGHGFRLLVSQGVVGLLLFCFWFGVVAWRTRRGPPAALCAHVVVLIGLVALAFYNLLPGQLHVLMLAAGIGLGSALAAEAGARDLSRTGALG